MNYEGLPIRCPHCRKSEWNETTAEFVPGQFVTGSMVRLQEKWRKRGMLRGFLNGCKQFQITCGFCQGKLVKKDGQLEVLGLEQQAPAQVPAAAPPPPDAPEPSSVDSNPMPDPVPPLDSVPPPIEEPPVEAAPDPVEALWLVVRDYMRDHPRAKWFEIFKAVRNPYNHWSDFANAMRPFEIKERRHG
jgi:hypothetical protein